MLFSLIFIIILILGVHFRKERRLVEVFPTVFLAFLHTFLSWKLSAFERSATIKLRFPDKSSFSHIMFFIL